MTASVQVFRKALATNSVGSSFVAKIPTTTAKSTSSTTGVYDLLDPTLGLHQGNLSSKFIQIAPYLVGANNDTFDLRLWGWSPSNDATPVWVPQLLIELNVTAGNISGSVIAANTFMADTIAIAHGDADSPEISPANDTSGSILVHLRGCRSIEFDFDNTSSATSMNAYWRPLDL